MLYKPFVYEIGVDEFGNERVFVSAAAVPSFDEDDSEPFEGAVPRTPDTDQEHRLIGLDVDEIYNAGFISCLTTRDVLYILLLVTFSECLINDDCSFDAYCDINEKVCKDPCIALKEGGLFARKGHIIGYSSSSKLQFFQSLRHKSKMQGENPSATVLLPQRIGREPSRRM